MPEFFKDGCLVDAFGQVIVRDVCLELTAQQAHAVANFLATIRMVDMPSAGALLIWNVYKAFKSISEGKPYAHATQSAGGTTHVDLRSLK